LTNTFHYNRLNTLPSEADQAKANQQKTAMMEVVVIDDPDKTSVPNISGNTTIAMISHQTEDEVASENTKTIQPFTSCYSNDMLTTFWPSIQLYVKNNPEHEHSKQWPQWILQGLIESIFKVCIFQVNSRN